MSSQTEPGTSLPAKPPLSASPPSTNVHFGLTGAHLQQKLSPPPTTIFLYPSALCLRPLCSASAAAAAAAALLLLLPSFLFDVD